MLEETSDLDLIALQLATRTTPDELLKPSLPQSPELCNGLGAPHPTESNEKKVYVRVSSGGPGADWMFPCEPNPNVDSRTNVKKTSPQEPCKHSQSYPYPLKIWMHPLASDQPKPSKSK